MNRPYIICHMVTSIDGKVTGDFLYNHACEQATEIYYELNRSYKADAFACGRITMEGSFTQGWFPDLSQFNEAVIPREDYIADTSAGLYAVSFDRKGRLGWKSSCISDEDPGYDNSHIIQILTNDATDAYLAYLQSVRVSYIFADDIPTALEKLYTQFGIKKLLLEGGSIINGAFAEADVIDELSLVQAPVIAGSDSKPLFYNTPVCGYELKKAKQLNGGALWLNYVRR